MSSDRFVVLGLARVRSEWFRDVSRWSTAAVMPLEFIKCVSIDELRARFTSGRAYSALLVDGALPGIDRDIVEQARELGCAVIVIDEDGARRDLAALGASAILPPTFDRELLTAVLSEHSVMIGASVAEPGARVGVPALSTPTGWRGEVITVTGAGGTGTSTMAMALAQGLGRDVRSHGRVLLADLALDADQAMLHDARDIVPGVQELVEAFRHGSPHAEDLLRLTFGEGHPYRLLLGLRRHRDWTAIRPRSFLAALDGLRRCFTHLVCDIDPDVEGERETGSFDIEDRNVMARSALDAASVVLVTGHAGVQGIHRLARLLSIVLERGVPAERVLPVVNRAPRSARARAELVRTMAQLVEPATADFRRLTSPVFVTEQRRLDQSLRDGTSLSPTLSATLTAAAFAVLDRQVEHPVVDLTDAALGTPERVTPGSLASWDPAEEATG